MGARAARAARRDPSPPPPTSSSAPDSSQPAPRARPHSHPARLTSRAPLTTCQQAPARAPGPQRSCPAPRTVPILHTPDPNPKRLGLVSAPLRLQEVPSPTRFFPLCPRAPPGPAPAPAPHPTAASSPSPPRVISATDRREANAAGNACARGPRHRLGLHPRPHACHFARGAALLAALLALRVLAHALIVVALTVDHSVRSSGNFLKLPLPTCWWVSAAPGPGGRRHLCSPGVGNPGLASLPQELGHLGAPQARTERAIQRQAL